MSESTTIRWEQDDDGIVILTLDDPNQSANTMNAAYAASMTATVERLEAEKDSITGVVITSAKKTFFAGGDLNDLIRRDEGRRRRDRRLRPRGQGACCAASRRSASRSSRRSTAPRSAAASRSAWRRHHRVVVDDSKAVVGFPEVQLGLLPGAGGVVRSVRMLGIVDALMQLLLQGQRLRPAKAKELGLVDEIVADARRPASRPPRRGSRRTPRPSSRGTSKGYKIPGGTPSNPEARAEPAGLPGQPAQADQGRQLPGAAPHHGRRRRGRAGRLRHRAGDRGPLLRRPRHRPGREEHDPGVLLRPAGGQRRPRAAGGHRAVRGQEGRRARRGHDGRRDRLRLREGRHRGRAQGRRPGGRRARQGLLARSSSRRASSAARSRRRRATRCSR